MERAEAERRVEGYWAPPCELAHGYPVRVEASWTVEYAWGWLIYLVPVDRTRCVRQYKFSCYACRRSDGRSTIVGTVGLRRALDHLDLPTNPGEPLSRRPDGIGPPADVVPLGPGRMTVADVRERLLPLWLAQVQQMGPRPAHLDESLTEEYEWGWVFYVVTSGPKDMGYGYHPYVCRRDTLDSAPGREDVRESIRLIGVPQPPGPLARPPDRLPPSEAGHTVWW